MIVVDPRSFFQFICCCCFYSLLFIFQLLLLMFLLPFIPLPTLPILFPFIPLFSPAANFVVLISNLLFTLYFSVVVDVFVAVYSPLFPPLPILLLRRSFLAGWSHYCQPAFIDTPREHTNIFL